MTDISNPKLSFRKSLHRPILRTQLSEPEVYFAVDITNTKNTLKSTISGHEPFSVSFTQKISNRDQPPSPGTIFLGCFSQQTGVFDCPTPLPITPRLFSTSSLPSATFDSTPDTKLEGQKTQFQFMHNPTMINCGNCEQLSVPNLKSYRRSSLAIQSTAAAELAENSFVPYANNTAYYHPTVEAKTSVTCVPANRGYFLGAITEMQDNYRPAVQLSSSSHSINPTANYSGQMASVITAMGSATCAKNRRKAVLTVDAKTTEILIASDSIRALFRLKDRSLIGKKLSQVFPVDSPVYRKNSTDSKNRFLLEDGNLKKGPLLLEKNVILDENQRLRPVYGKPVNILDAEGNKSTICLWSYPLTSTAALISQRKSSGIMRSPSAHLPSTTNNCQALKNTSDFIINTTSKTSPTSHQSITASELVDSYRTHQPSKPVSANLPSGSQLQTAVPQRSKSTCANYSPYLKVLHENSEESQFSLQSSSTTVQESNEQQAQSLQTAGQSSTTSSKTNNNNFISYKGDSCNQHLDQNMVESKRSYQNGDVANGNGPTAGEVDSNSENDENKRTRNGLKQTDISNHLIENDYFDKELPAGYPIMFAQNGECTVGSQHHFKLSNEVTKENEYNGESAAKRRWLITMEPINALQMQCILGAKGRIFRTDDSLANILGYNSTNLLFGTEINRLIPHLQIGLEWDNKIQMCCGTSIKKNGIPFSIVLHSDCDHDSGVANSFDLEIRSLSSINGVITITDSGLLYAYNENFLHELAGCELSSPEDRHEMDIKELIPDFYSYFEEAKKQQRINENKYFSCEDFNSTKRQLSRNSIEDEDSGSCTSSTTTAHSRNSSESASSTSASSHISDMEYPLTNKAETEQRNKDKDYGRQTSSASIHQDILPGTYLGLVKHVDGCRIPVKIEVTAVEISSNPSLFNVCVGFDRSNDYGFNQMSGHSSEMEDVHSEMEKSNSGVKLAHPALAKMAKFTNMCHSASSCFSNSSDNSSTDYSVPKFSVGGAFGTLRECDSDSAVDFIATKAMTDELHSSGSMNELHDVILQDRGVLEDENNDAVRGEYSKHYDTFQLIGNGAFGSVKLAARKDTGLLAVSKFVCKAKVLPESWVQSGKRGNRMIPIEVHLLETLNHSNIVKVLDVFENDKYYQLVMEKLGCGMDLFEFIENMHTKLDEPLTSYIFKQIVSAVDYLNENHIVHRDLKDENVIIDQNFCCKLIDFGSAAFFGENIVFSTFCGTLEYCSPEVLTGNKYLGPELEMWSLGILLYTLVFFQNPFANVRDIVQAEIEWPWQISEGLYQVLSWLLLPDPRRRATVAEIKSHWWVAQRVDPKTYSFKDILKNCERAQVNPPLYVTDLQNHLKHASSSCSNLANVSITSIEPIQETSSGIVSAR